MRINIRRGSHQIGGTCIEVEAQGSRLVLDIGMPLDAPHPDKVEMPNVQGFDKADTSLLGVVISHPHQDHYGLAARVPPTTPFLMGAATQQILATAMVFTPSGGKFANVIHLVDRKPINLGPFKLTPFLMDHSAFDSYAMLLEADGRKVFYTGDLRAHGYKAKLFERLVQHPPAAVDVLLMEGTTIGRKDTGERYQTEAELIPEFVRLFSATKGMALVWCSGQNIDRLVTLFKAARQAKRQFIVDMYTAAILDATGNEKIRAALHNNMRVFLPKSQKKQILVQGRFDVSNQYKALRIYPEELPDAASRSVMLFRPSMCQEVEQEHCLDGAELIYSMWDGYLKEKKTEWFLTWLKEHDIPLRKCHTSGHAPLCDLQRLRKAFASAVVVPVHCAEPENFVAHFGNVVRHADNEWWTVEHGKHPAGALNMNKLKENRGLSPKFVRDLCEGTLKPILERVQGDRTLDMEIRKEYINIYYRGGNLLKISPVAGTVGYDAFFDVQYGLPSDVEKFVTHSSDPETWVKQIPVLKDTMDLWFGKHPKEERASQQMAVHENNIAPWAGGTDYFIVDIEYDNHQGARFDLVALQWESKASARKLQGYKPRLTAIEMKSGDGALKGDAGLLEHFQQWDKFFSDRVQLNNFKDEMLKLFAQKRALGLIPALAGNHNPVTELDLAVEVIFLIANHDPASRKLRDEVRKVQAQVKSTPPEFNILCATATFMGYGLYLQNILTLDEFAKS